MKTSKKSETPPSIKAKLKSCDIEIQNYVTALETKNFKLNEEIAKFQVENMSLNSRVKALLAENEKAGAKFFVKAIKSACED